MMQEIALFDTHTHIGDPKFRDDLDNVLERARESGVGDMIAVGADLPSSINAVEMASSLDRVYASVGIHPHDATRVGEKELAQIEALCKSKRVVALGEIGLDYFKNYCPHDDQRNAFESQMDLAARLGMPVIIHNRDAADDCLRILSEHSGTVRGVAHCFSGDAAVAKRFLDLGYYISFSGTVTFPKATELAEAARMIPDDRLLIETDCPYLAPQAQRGKRNEPGFVRYVVARVAELRGVTVESVAEVTTANAYRLFNIR